MLHLPDCPACNANKGVEWVGGGPILTVAGEDPGPTLLALFRPLLPPEAQKGIDRRLSVAATAMAVAELTGKPQAPILKCLGCDHTWTATDYCAPDLMDLKRGESDA